MAHGILLRNGMNAIAVAIVFMTVFTGAHTHCSRHSDAPCTSPAPTPCCYYSHSWAASRRTSSPFTHTGCHPMRSAEPIVEPPGTGRRCAWTLASQAVQGGRISRRSGTGRFEQAARRRYLPALVAARPRRVAGVRSSRPRAASNEKWCEQRQSTRDLGCLPRSNRIRLPLQDIERTDGHPLTPAPIRSLPSEQEPSTWPASGRTGASSARPRAGGSSLWPAITPARERSLLLRRRLALSDMPPAATTA